MEHERAENGSPAVEDDRGLRLGLREHMEEKGLSMRATARALDMSAGRLSTWLSGKYTGKTWEIDERVFDFLQRQADMEDLPKNIVPFLETTAARRVRDVARVCHVEGDIFIVYGPAGVGKTEAVKEYAAKTTGVVLIEATGAYTQRVLFQSLHKALDFDGYGIVHIMFEDIVEKLTGSGRLIIVDEAEHLPSRAIDLLRRVHDMANVGILLVGTSVLIQNIRGRRGELQQLSSRAGAATRIGLLKPEDTRLFVEAAFPPSNGLWQAFHEASRGNTRSLIKLIHRTSHTTRINKVSVTPEVVRETARVLLV
jgi:DNA transposition AAA+ family ATPase